MTNSEHQSRPHQITKHKSKEEKGTHLGRRNNGGPLLVALLRRLLWLRRVPLFHGRGKARVALDYAGAWRDIGFSNRRLRPVLCGRLASRWGSGAVRPPTEKAGSCASFPPRSTLSVRLSAFSVMVTACWRLESRGRQRARETKAEDESREWSGSVRTVGRLLPFGNGVHGEWLASPSAHPVRSCVDFPICRCTDLCRASKFDIWCV